MMMSITDIIDEYLEERHINKIEDRDDYIEFLQSWIIDLFLEKEEYPEDET